MLIFSKIEAVARLAVISVIKIYQRLLSFDHGVLKIFKPYGHCKFRPTCSDYAIDAIGEYGVIKGVKLAINRVVRCNPWSRGGYDPVKKDNNT